MKSTKVVSVTPTQKNIVVNYKGNKYAFETEAIDVPADVAKYFIDQGIAQSTKEEKRNVYTEEAFINMNQDEQEFLIHSTTTTELPHYEKDRVKLLLKLQKEGADLLKIMKGYKPGGK